MKSKDSNKNNEKDASGKWVITVSVLSFLLSIVFTFLTTYLSNRLPVFVSIIILIFVVFIGIISDMVAMAITYAEEKYFHAKASKKIAGAKTSITLIRNAPKVSSIFADVVGDVCGILSGGIGTIISLKITSNYGIDFDLQVIIGATVAAVTIGGKARCKIIAKEYSSQIVDKFTKVISLFNFKEKNNKKN